MAILGPAELPSVLRVRSDPMKKYVKSKLGYGNINLEISEDQMECALRVTGDFIHGYFPKEQRLAYFNTVPLQTTYPLPRDAYWVQNVWWDPSITRVDDIFGFYSHLFAPGYLNSTSGVLTDFHLMESYKKTAKKILSAEGHWDVLGEVDGEAGEQLLRLSPVPKGSYAVVVEYYPHVSHFRSPIAKLLANEMLLAEVTMMIGYARRKVSNMPGPDGSTVGMDGDAMVTEGAKMREELIKKAISLGEPMPVVMM